MKLLSINNQADNQAELSQQITSQRKYEINNKSLKKKQKIRSPNSRTGKILHTMNTG